MEIIVESRPAGVAVLCPVGRLDLLTAAALRARVVQAVDAGHQRLVIDLGQTTFIDSSGLGALIGALKVTRSGGGDLRLARPNEQARLALRLTTLDRVLRLFPTVDQALDAF
jgi:anti-sigma B factor antagonist